MSASLASLEAFQAGRQAEGWTGALMGLDLAGRDALWAKAQAQVEAVWAQRPEALDASPLSLTDGGDTWVRGLGGRYERHLSQHPGLASFLAQAARRAAPVGPPDPEALWAALDEAGWAPSATNGQPIRAWLWPQAHDPAWRALAGLEAQEAPGALGLLLVRKRKYDSLMGDVFEPFGLEVTAREESIDAGIFAATLAWGLQARGHSLREWVLPPEARGEASRLVAAQLAGHREPWAQELAEALASGSRLVDACLWVGRAPSAPTWPDWASLSRRRSTQRVASPTRPLGAEVEDRLWAQALASLLPGQSPGAHRLVGFDWQDRSPAAIGQAMFERLYGVGADPDTRQGGQGGILAAATLNHLLQEAESRQPGAVAAQLGGGWASWSPDQLAAGAKDFAMGPGMMGPHLLARLGAEGRYRVEGDRLLDARGQALSAPVAVRLMKALAGTFGRHFLAFQTTHPRNAVLLTEEAPGDPHLRWREVGHLAAALGLLARAEGLSAIVKTGPVDLAPRGVAEALAANPDRRTILAELGPALRAGHWRPALTFQVGWPLGPEDPVGGAGGHDGIEERRRDKRPPRLRLSDWLWV